MCCCSMPVWPTAGLAATGGGLAPAHRCVSFDARGHGRTTYQPEPFSRVGDALAVLDSSARAARSSSGTPWGTDGSGPRPRPPGADDGPGPHRTRDQWRSAARTHPRSRPSTSRCRLPTTRDLHLLNQLEARFWLDGINGGAQGRVGGEARELFLDMNRQALAAEPPGDEDRSTNAWQRLEQLTVPTLVVVGDLDYDVSTANALTAAQRIQVPRSTDCPMPPTSRFSRERGVPAGRHGVRRLTVRRDVDPEHLALDRGLQPHDAAVLVAVDVDRQGGLGVDADRRHGRVGEPGTCLRQCSSPLRAIGTHPTTRVGATAARWSRPSSTRAPGSTSMPSGMRPTLPASRHHRLRCSGGPPSRLIVIGRSDAPSVTSAGMK